MTKQTKTTAVIATLIRGASYSLRNTDGSWTRFARGQEVQVTAEQRERLEKAFDRVTRPHPETDRPVAVHLPKFSFSSSTAA